jgi:hypothetical protein
VSDFETSDFSSPEPVKVEREGLPAGYRMRADAHYVDTLTSNPRSDRAREASRTAWADEAARTAPQDRRLFDQLAEDVGAIESAASLLAGERSALLRRVGLDLIKAQSARASWLLRAMALGDAATDADTQPRRRLLRDVLAQLRDRVSVECRLMGVGLEMDVAPDAGATPVAEALVAAGVTGAILAQLGLADGQDGAHIRVRASIPQAEGAAVSIEISQDATAIPAASHARFFDASWVNRPGGWLGAMGAATARTAAERLGGGISLATADRRGAVIRLVLP